MASRFEGVTDKTGADVYLLAAPGSKQDGAEGEPSASISEAIARVRFRKQSGASVGGMIFIEGLGFIDEDEFDELLDVVAPESAAPAIVAQAEPQDPQR